MKIIIFSLNMNKSKILKEKEKIVSNSRQTKAYAYLSIDSPSERHVGHGNMFDRTTKSIFLFQDELQHV